MQILVTKPGTLSKADRIKLRRAGVVSVEAENPNEVRFLQTDGPELSAGDMLVAAARAINNHDLSRQAFGKAFAEIVEFRWKQAEGSEG